MRAVALFTGKTLVSLGLLAAFFAIILRPRNSSQLLLEVIG